MRYALQQQQLGELGQQDSSTCISLMQQRLYAQGRIPRSAVTGYYNNETYAALSMYFGAGWDKTPGGACGIWIALQALPQPAYSPYPYYPSNLIMGMDPTTFALVAGGAVLLLILGTRK